MFSVVIPLYNKELSIRNTIQSVLDQTCQDFEIVVVNDGSTDNSDAVVEAIDDERIRRIHQKNQGVSAARNRGIEEAKHEWVAFLDGDDLWKTEHLDEFSRSIAKYSDVNWLFSGFSVYYRKKVIDKVFREDGRLENVFDAMLKGAVIHTSTVCVRKELFFSYEGLWFTLGLNSSEDREVWYKLACIDNRPIYIARSLSIYRAGVVGSLTSINGATPNDQFLNMKERLSKYFVYASEQDRIKLIKYISMFNRQALLHRYVRGLVSESYKSHLKGREYFILNLTVRLPKALRFAISKVLVKLIG